VSSAAPEPTDLELMMLLDGELDAERRAEVEAFLAEAGEDEGAASRSKLGGMRAVSRVVASLDWPAGDAKGASTFDVSDAVLAALPATKKPVASETPIATTSRTPANDNSRAIFGFAIAAAAAAAAVFFWGKTGDDPVTTGADPVAMTAPPDAPGPSGERPPLEPPPLLGDLADVAKTDPADEPRYGVEVATVDFGARSGAIYYVPGIEDAAGKAAVTTVVWLNDD
jgi:hypothetical protein